MGNWGSYCYTGEDKHEISDMTSNNTKTKNAKPASKKKGAKKTSGSAFTFEEGEFIQEYEQQSKSK